MLVQHCRRLGVLSVRTQCLLHCSPEHVGGFDNTLCSRLFLGRLNVLQNGKPSNEALKPIESPGRGGYGMRCPRIAHSTSCSLGPRLATHIRLFPTANQRIRRPFTHIRTSSMNRTSLTARTLLKSAAPFRAAAVAPRAARPLSVLATHLLPTVQQRVAPRAAALSASGSVRFKTTKSWGPPTVTYEELKPLTEQPNDVR
jgi:hypothetical protein